MTDVANTANEAVSLATRKLTAAEITFSLDFVVKLSKALVKAHPDHSPEQVAAALETVYREKLAKLEKRLLNVEKVRSDYNAVKSAEDAVESVAELMRNLATREAVDHAAKIISQKPAPVAKKAATKANGKAHDEAQTSLAV